jgi:hypothetical protein
MIIFNDYYYLFSREMHVFYGIIILCSANIDIPYLPEKIHITEVIIYLCKYVTLSA